MSTLNPAGSDTVALANVVAPRASRVLLCVSEGVGIIVVLLSAALLAAVVMATHLDHEIVAVAPGGAMLPLVQLDKKNEQAQRALLRADTSAGTAPANPPSAPSAPQATPGPRNPATKQ